MTDWQAMGVFELNFNTYIYSRYFNLQCVFLKHTMPPTIVLSLQNAKHEERHKAHKINLKSEVNQVIYSSAPISLPNISSSNTFYLVHKVRCDEKQMDKAPAM